MMGGRSDCRRSAAIEEEKEEEEEGACGSLAPAVEALRAR